MSRPHAHFPLRSTVVLRRATLIALLVAGGGGIAWACLTMP